jgi:elongation factor Ts
MRPSPWAKSSISVAFVIVKPTAAEGVATYIHMGGKISVLAILDKPSDELAKPLAMHIAANNPLYIES